MVTHASIVTIETQTLCLIMFIFVISTTNLLAFLIFEEVRREELKLPKRLFNKLFNKNMVRFSLKNWPEQYIRKQDRIYLFCRNWKPSSSYGSHVTCTRNTFPCSLHSMLKQFRFRFRFIEKMKTYIHYNSK